MSQIDIEQYSPGATIFTLFNIDHNIVQYFFLILADISVLPGYLACGHAHLEITNASYTTFVFSQESTAPNMYSFTVERGRKGIN